MSADSEIQNQCKIKGILVVQALLSQIIHYKKGNIYETFDFLQGTLPWRHHAAILGVKRNLAQGGRSFHSERVLRSNAQSSLKALDTIGTLKTTIISI